MLIIKGFAQHASFVNNTPGTTHILGEISSLALTFTKQKGFYKNSAISTDIGLISFTVTQDDVSIVIPNEVRDTILQVLSESYEYGINKGTGVITPEALRIHLLSKFNADIDIKHIGQIESDGFVGVPQFINFSIRNQPENDVTVWFTDESFRGRFPDYEIVIIPPFDRLDDFFELGGIVEEKLKDVTASIIVEKMQNATKGHPETMKQVQSFIYHDPNNPSRRLPTDWGVLVYGAAGANIDAIKDAIIDKILSESNRTRDEWAVIFPEIFRRNEFVIVPFWDKYSIPNMTTQAGMYSPFVPVKDAVAYAKRFTPDYVQSHVSDYCNVTGVPYRSLSVVSIGHIENPNGTYSISDVYPDWINTNTNQDFNRMETRTQEWSLELMRTIKEAEKFEEFDLVPDNLMKTVRDGKLFLTFTREKVNYLVACKSNFN